MSGHSSGLHERLVAFVNGYLDEHPDTTVREVVTALAQVAAAAAAQCAITEHHTILTTLEEETRAAIAARCGRFTHKMPGLRQ